MHTVSLEQKGPGLAGVAGLNTGHVPGIKALQGRLYRAIKAAGGIESWVEAGGYDTPEIEDEAITELDIADPTRIWLAANDSISRVTDENVMSGRKRWYFTNQAKEGFRGKLKTAPSAWSGVTIFVPDFELMATGLNHGIWASGQPAAERPTLYVNTDNQLVWRVGDGATNNVIATSDPLVVGSRNTIIGRMDNTSKEASLYINSALPSATETMGRAMTGTTDYAIGGSPDDAVDGHSKFSECLTISREVSDPEIAVMALVGLLIRNYTLG